MNSEELVFSDLKQIQRDESIYYTTDNDKRITRHQDTEMYFLIQALIEIETFVSTITYSNVSTSQLLRKLALDKITLVLHNYPIFPIKFEYSEFVNLFFKACDELQFRQRLSTLKNNFDISCLPSEQSRELFRELVTLIRQRSVMPEFKYQVHRRKIDASRNFKSMSEYVNELFEFKSPLMVLRIDFSYKKEIARFVSFEDAKSDMERFLRNRRSNKRLFDGWLGYIMKIEYGIEKGYHWHALIFLNGTLRKHDIYWSMEIGKYWTEIITQGRGLFFSSNARKDIPAERSGRGMIHRTDIQKRKNLLHIVGYMTKAEQFIRISKACSKDKSITKGEVPVRTSNAGRPRNTVAVSARIQRIDTMEFAPL